MGSTATVKFSVTCLAQPDPAASENTVESVRRVAGTPCARSLDCPGRTGLCPRADNYDDNDQHPAKRFRRYQHRAGELAGGGARRGRRSLRSDVAEAVAGSAAPGVRALRAAVRRRDPGLLRRRYRLSRPSAHVGCDAGARAADRWIRAAGERDDPSRRRARAGRPGHRFVPRRRLSAPRR